MEELEEAVCICKGEEVDALRAEWNDDISFQFVGRVRACSQGEEMMWKGMVESAEGGRARKKEGKMDIVGAFRKRTGGEGEASSSRKKRKTKHKRKEVSREMVLVDEATDQEAEAETPGELPADITQRSERVARREEAEEERREEGEGREARGKFPYDDLSFSDKIFKMAGARVDYGGLVNMRKRDATRTIRNMALQIALQSHIVEEDVVEISGEATELNAELQDTKRCQEQLTMLIGQEKSKNEQMAMEMAEAREALAKAESLLEAERKRREEEREAAEVAEARIRSEYEKGGPRRGAIEEEVRKSGAFKANAYRLGMQLYKVALDDAEAKIPGQTDIFAELRGVAQKQLDNPISFPSGDDEGDEVGEEAGTEVSSGRRNASDEGEEEESEGEGGSED